MTVTRAGSTIRVLLEAATARLATAGIATPRVDAEWLLVGIAGMRRGELALALDRELDAAVAGRYTMALERRARREPLQQVLGWEEFRGLRLAVTSDVLVPRPETEVLVEWALAMLPRPGQRRPLVVDVGTGSGCIACAIAHERPDARVVALDTSMAALDVARRNVRALGLAARVGFIHSDSLTAIGPERIDLITANMPYCPSAQVPTLMPEVRDYEPRAALDGGPDGLTVIQAVITDARRTLRPGGALVLETWGGAQLDHAVGLLEAAGFVDVATRPDLAGILRFVAGWTPSSAGIARAILPGGRHRKGGEAPLRAN